MNLSHPDTALSRQLRLLASLRTRGVQISVRDEQIHLHAPNGTVLQQEIAELRSGREQIVAHLHAVQTMAAVPLMPGCRTDTFALTPTQRMPWYRADTRELRCRTSPFVIRIRGALDLQSLRRSLEALRHRHELLRARVVTVSTGVRQRIAPMAEYGLDVFDVSAERASRVEQVATRHAQEFIDRRLDYTVDPLFDSCVVKVADDDHLLVISIDHLITDGLSNEILKSELWKLYTYATQQPSFPPLRRTLQFADYAAWLEQLHPLWVRAHGPYWTTFLADAQHLEQPLVVGSAHAGVAHFCVAELSLGSTLTAKLLRFAQGTRVLPALVLLTTFLAATSRCRDQRDLTVALVDSGRHRAELASMIGCLSGHLHLRVGCNEHTTLGGLLTLVNEEFSLACQHRDFDWVRSLVPEFSPDLCFNWAAPPSTGVEDLRGTVTSGGVSMRLELVPVSLSNDAMAEIMAALPFKLMLFSSLSANDLRIQVASAASWLTQAALEHFLVDLRVSLETLVEQRLVRLEPLTRSHP